jgi:hypothetical protein
MKNLPQVVNRLTCFHNLPTFFTGTSLLYEMKRLRRLRKKSPYLDTGAKPERTDLESP